MNYIAVVEDSAQDRAVLDSYLEKYQQEKNCHFQITHFSDGDEIALGYKGGYDLILMDIEMTFLDGMSAAEEIRRADPEVLIIFITNSPQYAIKGYAVGALDYILKPVPVDGGMRRLDAAAIYYIEGEGHRVHFYTEDGDFSAPGALKALEEKLAGRLLARCNSGYLVNLAQVSGVQQNTVQVGPHELQISRPKRKAFLAALADYIGGGGA